MKTHKNKLISILIPSVLFSFALTQVTFADVTSFNNTKYSELNSIYSISNNLTQEAYLNTFIT